MTTRRKSFAVNVAAPPFTAEYVQTRCWPGTFTRAVRHAAAWVIARLKMSKITKILKAGAVAGVCGIGLCALAKKANLSERIADFAHSVEAVPFPGTEMYSFLASKQLQPFYAAIAQEIVDADLFVRILDIGTGIGFLPIEIAKLNPAVCVSGIDTSRDLIQVAEAEARASHVKNSVEFMTGDPANLPFPGRYFDLVVSVNLLHHWENPSQIFEEIFHILEPGGQFWIYDYRKDVPRSMWESLQKSLPFHLRMALAMGPMPSSRAAYSDEELLEMAGQSHFVNPTLEHRTLPLFGQPAPVFHVLKLKKPEQITE